MQVYADYVKSKGNINNKEKKKAKLIDISDSDSQVPTPRIKKIKKGDRPKIHEDLAKIRSIVNRTKIVAVTDDPSNALFDVPSWNTSN